MIKKSLIVLLHIGYWSLYLFLLFIIFVLTIASQGGANGQFWPMLYEWSEFMLVIAIIPGAIGFYVGYSILFKRFFARKKIIKLLLAMVATALLCSAVGFLMGHIIYSEFRLSQITIEGIIAQVVLISFMSGINMTIGIIMQGFITAYSDIAVKEELTRKNTEIELALVRSQLNPHFLFNTINNIDVLIQIDPEKASRYLNELSQIMRYMLYETKTERVPLSREIDYMHKYIALQKIRTSIENYVVFEVDGNVESASIEPMILLPFLENAFKHAEKNRKENAIKIHLSVEAQRIYFKCENTFLKKLVVPTISMSNGLGNELIQKRISLLYGEHELRMYEQDEVYHVELILPR